MHPLCSYVKGKCVQRPETGHVRQLSAGEREILIGFPAGYTASLYPPETEAHKQEYGAVIACACYANCPLRFGI